MHNFISHTAKTSNFWQSCYTNSSKEKDSETSYSYFGAHYYDSDLSVWLSADPMSDMRLHTTIANGIQFYRQLLLGCWWRCIELAEMD